MHGPWNRIKKKKEKSKLKITKIINVPAYDCNWPFCFCVSCERNQTDDVAHRLRTVSLKAAHWLSQINGPCFIVFLLKNNIQILFKSHWKKMYIYSCVYLYILFLSNNIYSPLFWLFPICYSLFLSSVRVANWLWKDWLFLTRF